MKRPDSEFMRRALRTINKRAPDISNTEFVKKLMLESFNAPVISLWEKPFEQTEPAMFCKGRKYTNQEEYELLSNWLYDDFVLLTEGEWTDYETGETGPMKNWTYFIKNHEAYPLCEALCKDAADSSFMQGIIADPSAPKSEVYESNPDHFYFAVSAASNFENGKWSGPATLGIFCFWFPSPDDLMYSTTSQGDHRWVYFPTKST